MMVSHANNSNTKPITDVPGTLMPFLFESTVLTQLYEVY